MTEEERNTIAEKANRLSRLTKEAEDIKRDMDYLLTMEYSSIKIGLTSRISRDLNVYAKDDWQKKTLHALAKTILEMRLNGIDSEIEALSK